MNQSTPPRHAVVIGGSLAGLLAAAVLAEHATVTVIDADPLPEGPAPRRGLPQARHTHLLWSGGARAIERILPGITDDWTKAGAIRRSLPTDLVSKTAHGWIPRCGEKQFNISCSRDLLDSVVRARVTGLKGSPRSSGAGSAPWRARRPASPASSSTPRRKRAGC